MFHRALWLNFVAELMEIYRLSAAKLLEHLGRFFLRDVEASAFNDTFDFTWANFSIHVHVQTVECLNNVEVRIACKSLSYSFSSYFDFEMHSPHVAELHLSVSEETVVTAHAVVSVVRGPTIQHVGIVAVLRHKCIGELSEVYSFWAVPLKKQVNLVSCWEHTNRGETVSQIATTDRASTMVVENVKCIVKIEIGFQSHSSFGSFKFAFLINQVTKSMYELVFINAVQRWLAWWRAAAHNEMARWTTPFSGAATARRVSALKATVWG